MLDYLFSIDVGILKFINQDLQFPLFDFLFPYFTNLHKINWVAWGIFPLIAGFWYFKERKRSYKIFFALLITAGMSDAIGYRVLKPAVQRVRPNNRPEIAKDLRLLRDPQSYSFPSNHAMNSFAVVGILVSYHPVLKWFLFPMAIIISLCRVYAGVHYPSDIIFGAFLGLLLAWSLKKYFFSRFKIFN